MPRNLINNNSNNPGLGYPSYFPRHVPPSKAVDANGTFFRIVKTDPPSSECFKNMYESDYERLKKFKGLELKCCYGVSVYRDEEPIVNAFAKFPEGSDFQYLAKGEVKHTDGKMLKTGESNHNHYTVWLVEGCEIYNRFNCIRSLIDE
ncbi:hypothetical protein U9K49_05805 [Pantoea agglomerans]|uniref:hypothetical protein n=1 Tax=Enterobacter agglomerans TaxID=549 RepID=UPI002D799154|nr:hypothetical protein [Pantoea agglomerans]WRO91269.1 hypothetical protein U9K49_05805 [Pantoea agglomerans]